MFTQASIKTSRSRSHTLSASYTHRVQVARRAASTTGVDTTGAVPTREELLHGLPTMTTVQDTTQDNVPDASQAGPGTQVAPVAPMFTASRPGKRARPEDDEDEERTSEPPAKMLRVDPAIAELARRAVEAVQSTTETNADEAAGQQADVPGEQRSGQISNQTADRAADHDTEESKGTAEEPAKPTTKRTKRACSVCRLLKRKCEGENDDACPYCAQHELQDRCSYRDDRGNSKADRDSDQTKQLREELRARIKAHKDKVKADKAKTTKAKGKPKATKKVAPPAEETKAEATAEPAPADSAAPTTEATAPAEPTASRPLKRKRNAAEPKDAEEPKAKLAKTTTAKAPKEPKAKAPKKPAEPKAKAPRKPRAIKPKKAVVEAEPDSAVLAPAEPASVEPAPAEQAAPEELAAEEATAVAEAAVLADAELPSGTHLWHGGPYDGAVLVPAPPPEGRKWLLFTPPAPSYTRPRANQPKPNARSMSAKLRTVKAQLAGLLAAPGPGIPHPPLTTSDLARLLTSIGRCYATEDQVSEIWPSTRELSHDDSAHTRRASYTVTTHRVLTGASWREEELLAHEKQLLDAVREALALHTLALHNSEEVHTNPANGEGHVCRNLHLPPPHVCAWFKRVVLVTDVPGAAYVPRRVRERMDNKKVMEGMREWVGKWDDETSLRKPAMLLFPLGQLGKCGFRDLEKVELRFTGSYKEKKEGLEIQDIMDLEDGYVRDWVERELGKIRLESGSFGIWAETREGEEARDLKESWVDAVKKNPEDQVMENAE